MKVSISKLMMQNKSLTHHYYCYGLILRLLMAAAFFQHTESQAKTRDATLIFQSKAEQLSVTQNGVITTHKRGKPVKVSAGFHEFRVTAAGSSVRTVRTWLNDGETQNFYVDLTPSKQTFHLRDWHSSDRMIPPRSLTEGSTLCDQFAAQNLSAHLCRRDHFLDDLNFAEPDPLDPRDLQTLLEQADLQNYLGLLSQRAQQDPLITQRIEILYAKHGSISAVSVLAAHHNLIRGDCRRVHTILADGQQTLEDVRPLLFYKALCSELQGRKDDSVKHLRAALELSQEDVPYIYYHLGRLRLDKSPLEVSTLAQSCVKTTPHFIPCYELGLIAAHLSDKPYKLPKFNIDELTFKTMLSLESTLKDKTFEQSFMSLAKLISAYPQALEFYLMLAWLDASKASVIDLDFIDKKIKTSWILGGHSLDSIIDILEKQKLTRLLPAVYSNKIRMTPQDPNLWLRLVRAHHQAGQCREALEVIEEGAEILPKYNKPLLLIQANCLIQQDRPLDATAVYKKLIDISAPNWNYYQGLGFAYGKLKRNRLAIQAYQKALETNPPPDIKDALVSELNKLQSTKINQEKP